ncbi:metalloregulator ArsR/SmtB family transcription factor [Microbulbifer sp. SA54]|uniref:metalloregulator ArsR/SmtB family transcription factor n=1 Tax=Microbulbifer sp. SA54 TaxID=3401577 RepID=UPI003AACF7A0
MNPVQFYKCLADDTRLRCLLLITQESELCVCELTAALDESQPKVSRHLSQLRQCGLLADRRQGQWVFYRLADDLPAWARNTLTTTLQHNQDYLADAHTALCRMGNRPERSAICC